MSAATTIESVLRRVTAHSRAAARGSGLTVPQVVTLRALRDTPGPTPAVIAARTGLSRSSMTSVLDRLEQQALVKRERSELDRRKVLLVLTAEGAARAATLGDPLLDLLEDRLVRLSTRDLARVTEGLGILDEVLDAEGSADVTAL